MIRINEALLALLVFATIAVLLLAARFVPLPFPYDLRRPYILAGALGLGMVLGTAEILLWARAVRLDTIRRLDAVLPGFTSSTMGWVGRQYDRTVNGRGVRVRFYRGPSFEIRVSCRNERMLRVDNDEASEDPPAPGLEGLHATPLDAWTKGLLADPAAAEPLRRLTRRDDTSAVSIVEIHHGEVRVVHHKAVLARITPERTAEWVDSAVRLAELVERR